MDHLANIPVTILVKAPNQKIGDQTVECFMDWTVKRLKSHLAAVYPSKPAEKNQRIIYSGKLLQDHSVLQDVLRSIDSETLHTVHLVCTPTPEEIAESGKSFSPPNQLSGSSTPLRQEPANVVSSSQRTSMEDSTTDGIRQRSHRPRETSNVTAGYSASYYQGSASVAAAYQNMSPQQLQWMQQLYVQQMAYYMQYSSQPGMNQPWAPPVAYQIPQQPIEQPPPPVPINQAAAPPIVNNNAAPVPEPARNAPRVPNQQMNAGVGPAMNDDVEEEAANRDWLDWIYTLCRFGVLLSIVYFYSSMNRFLLVTGIMFLVYLYEHNFFRLRRAHVARVQIEERIGENEEEAAADQIEDENADGSSNRNDETPDTDQHSSPDSSNENSDDIEETSRPESPPEEHSRPGFFGTLWIFVSTFFTSLIPQGPQHLNVN